jgi:peptidoglycan/xylan/chitin deacetylase (PgdA/CDA1 family)
MKRVRTGLLPVVGVGLLLCAPTLSTPASGHSRAIPILMYHVIQPAPTGAPYPDLFVPKAEFAAQMRRLAQSGYHAVTLKRVYYYWRDGRPLPSRPIVLSFDDGYRSVYLSGFPVLKRLGWPGVINLAVKNDRHSWGLRPWVVRTLIRAGWELDSHTINHPDLTTVGATQLREEVAESRQILRRQFHVPVDFFCYPSGRYDNAVIAAVQAAGYLGATSTRYGLARPSELWTLARVRMNGSDGASGLAAKLKALGA